MYTAISKTVVCPNVIVDSRILEPKRTLGMVIMSNNTAAKVVVVWLCHYMMNFHSILCKVNANSNKLFCTI